MKEVKLKVPAPAFRYLKEKHGNVAELCQGLLNDALISIIEKEAKDVELGLLLASFAALLPKEKTPIIRD